ncbi:MAG: hypothetical protein QW416_09015 [Candidatus Nitrosocaldaceae archaeon]
MRYYFLSFELARWNSKLRRMNKVRCKASIYLNLFLLAYIKALVYSQSESSII